MTLDIGEAALWMAATLALVQVASGSRPVAVGQAVMAAVSLAAMIGTVPGRALALAMALLGLAMFVLLRRSRWSRRMPSANAGIVLAITGAALIGIGSMCDVAFPQTATITAKTNDHFEMGPWLVEFATVNPVVGPDFTGIEAELRATRGRGVSVVRPQWRTPVGSSSASSEAATTTFIDGRLSAAFDGSNDSRRFRLRWQPFLPLIWLGEVLVLLGGAIALIARLIRQWTRRPPPRGRYG